MFDCHFALSIMVLNLHVHVVHEAEQSRDHCLITLSLQN